MWRIVPAPLISAAAYTSGGSAEHPRDGVEGWPNVRCAARLVLWTRREIHLDRSNRCVDGQAAFRRSILPRVSPTGCCSLAQESAREA